MEQPKPVHSYWGHMLQLLQPVRLELVLSNKVSHHNEKAMHGNEEQPYSLQLEKAHAQQRPRRAKNKFFFLKKGR